MRQLGIALIIIGAVLLVRDLVFGDSTEQPTPARAAYINE